MKKYLALIGLLLLVTGCSTVLERPAEITTYRFTAPVDQLAANPLDRHGTSLRIFSVAPASGFDTARMAYSREPLELSYYTRSRWVAPVADLVAEVVKQSFEASNAFDIVVGPGSRLTTRWGLRIELNELTHTFIEGGSVARVEMIVSLVDIRQRDVVQSLRLQVSEPVTSTDAAGFARATDAAMHQAMQELVPFVYEGITRAKAAGE